MASFQSQIIRTMRQAMTLPDLAPTRVADLLGRRLQVEREDDYKIVYTLVGGAAIPFTDGTSVWVKVPKKGMLQLKLAEACRIPIPDLEKEFGGPPNYRPILADPRSRDTRHSYAYRAEVGELRLVFRDFEANFTMESFIVTEIPVVDWASAPATLFPPQPVP